MEKKEEKMESDRNRIKRRERVSMMENKVREPVYKKDIKSSDKEEIAKGISEKKKADERLWSRSCYKGEGME